MAYTHGKHTATVDAGPRSARAFLCCPRCDLRVPKGRVASGLEYCPRCLARSSGALSVALSPSAESAQARNGIVVRLLSGVRLFGGDAGEDRLAS